MPNFSYKAIDESGKIISGFLESDSPEKVNQLLSLRNQIPVKVKESKQLSGNAGRRSGGGRSVKTRDLILFTKQFKTMLKAGVPMLELLQILEKQTENNKFNFIIKVMMQDIEKGVSLYNSFSKHSTVFSPLYCSVVRAGESSGKLPEVLDRLAYILEHEDNVKSNIKAALRYPTIVLAFLIMAFGVLLTFVIPNFAKAFEKSGVTLPIPTRICLFLYNFAADYWLVIFIIAGSVAAFLVYFLKTDRGRYLRDSLLIHFPILGPLFIKASMSRFASIFSILQDSGVAVLESMDILSETIANAAISKEFVQVKKEIEKGNSISAPLKTAKYFTPMIVNMVAIGEGSGKLAEMLKEVSDHYDSEVEFATLQLTEYIGPVLTIALAAMVGFFALAIFIPMWDLTKTVM
ncbi:type II secretion system F family protein [Desulfobacterales bacterium HSG16]|nr:type II secretion system F family protein [Desulfobacterales bacterium HSG16]